MSPDFDWWDADKASFRSGSISKNKSSTVYDRHFTTDGKTIKPCCEDNKYGAISAICSNGDPLGVKPGEFAFVSALQWVLEHWIPNATAISALNAFKKKDGDL